MNVWPVRLSMYNFSQHYYCIYQFRLYTLFNSGNILLRHLIFLNESDWRHRHQKSAFLHLCPSIGPTELMMYFSQVEQIIESIFHPLTYWVHQFSAGIRLWGVYGSIRKRISASSSAIAFSRRQELTPHEWFTFAYRTQINANDVQ